MAISDSTLYSNIWSDIKSALVTPPIYTTNTVTSSTSRVGVTASFSDQLPIRPSIVVRPAIQNESFNKFGTQGKKLIYVTVECYDQTTRGLDQISEQVEDRIKTTGFGGAELVAIASDYSFNEFAVNKYEMKSIVFTFDRE